MALGCPLNTTLIWDQFGPYLGNKRDMQTLLCIFCDKTTQPPSRDLFVFIDWA